MRALGEETGNPIMAFHPGQAFSLRLRGHPTTLPPRIPCWAVIRRLNSVAGFAEPALSLIGHTPTYPQTLPRGLPSRLSRLSTEYNKVMIGTIITSEGESLKNRKQRMNLRGAKVTTACTRARRREDCGGQIHVDAQPGPEAFAMMCPTLLLRLLKKAARLEKTAS